MVTPTIAMGAIRYLNVHEYISMELMNAHGIVTPRGYVASTPDEAEIIYQTEFAKRE
jgi:succinyl-CoA synthetase beta subunit